MRDRHRIPALVASLGLMASLLFAGNAGAAVRRSPDETSHTVRQGEMLSAIAQQHGITLDALAAANVITAAEDCDAMYYVVVDLHSTNGTLVNGEAISRTFLHDGDKIQVG